MLKLYNVSKSYKNIKAVNNVSLNVGKGDFIAIVGSSGSGKSTLLNLIGGLCKVTAGEIIIDGINITNLKQDQMAIFRRNNIGIIYQFFNLIPVLTVKENIMLPLTLNKEKIDWKYFNKIIKTLNLKKYLNFLPEELSGGTMQRVAIARAMINKPKLILADEPTGNLDSKNTVKVIEMIRQCNKDYNQTIIMVTHDMDVAKKADKILEYEDGKICL